LSQADRTVTQQRISVLILNSVSSKTLTKRVAQVMDSLSH
jgi:hypothetical protein